MCLSRHVLHLRLPARGSLATGYIGGGIPSLPTVTRLASNAPPGVLVAAGIKIFAFGFRCLVPESRGAILTRQSEGALWQTFFTAAPVQRREFDPSSKRRKRRPVVSPVVTA